MMAFSDTAIDTLKVIEAARAAFAAADLDMDQLAPAVVPLRELIKAQPLLVDELPGLTGHSAETFLRSQGKRVLDFGTARHESLAGFLYANDGGGWIMIDRRDPVARRRFSVAHELGHFLLHFLPLSLQAQREATLSREDGMQFREALPALDDEVEPEQSRGVVTYTRLEAPLVLSERDLARMEQEADRFAAEVLMPEPACRRAVVGLGGRAVLRRDALARRLATVFLVSPTAMQRRLFELGLP